MDEINEKIQDLLEAIYRTDTYRVYREQETLLHQNPELSDRLRKFRGDNFRMQNQSGLWDSVHPEMPRNEMTDEAASVYQESRTLRSYEVCNAYLDAELALCRLLQKIAGQICDGIEMDVPQV